MYRASMAKLAVKKICHTSSLTREYPLFRDFKDRLQKLFSSNKSKITQKEISDQAHPHHEKNRTSKSAILEFFRLKIEFA